LTLNFVLGKAQESKIILEHPRPEIKMVDPQIDNPQKPWCYLQNSTTVIGVPYMPDAVQVTYDGAIYTRSAELCFFYGKLLKPVMQRQKRWYKGWIPIVKYNWESEKISYEVEMFAFPLNAENEKNTLQFIRVKITNENLFDCKAKFTVATRSTGEENRFGAGIFSPLWIYRFNENRAIRNDKLIYTFSGQGDLSSIYGRKYEGPFTGSEFGVKENTSVCLVNYTPLLKPGQSEQFIFKMPREPVDTANVTFIKKIEDADYNNYRRKTISYWENLILHQRTTFDIPETRVNDALKASLVHMMLATRQRDGKRFMTDGLPYPDLFLTSFVQHEKAFDCFGFKEFVDQTLPYVYAKQDAEGLFYDGALLHGKKLGVAQGQAIQSLCEHYFLTRDKSYLDTIYPKIKAGITWLKNAITTDEHHLMPVAWPYDNEMILGHYTSNNLWAILAFRSAIRIARDLGKRNDVTEWVNFQHFYEASLLKAINVAFKQKGYVPPGLYDYKIGEEARDGFKDWQTNQEWENMLLASPSELLAHDNPIIDSTLNHIRRDRYREGIMTYRIFLHQYITVNMMDQELAKADSKQALIDLYNVLLHLGSTYEGFENLVKPWEDRKVSADCPTPHVWASSKLVCFIRDMLVREYGGEAGMDEGMRSLYLFSLISPSWCKKGQQVNINNARTEMGTISASMRFTSSGANVTISPVFHTLPKRIVITIPYFVHLIKFTTDASNSVLKGRELFLSPDARHLNLSWEFDKNKEQENFTDLLERYRSESVLKIVNDKEVITPVSPYLLPGEKDYPSAPLSFDFVKKAFIYEYTNKYNLFKNAGGKIDKVAAPPLIPED